MGRWVSEGGRMRVVNLNGEGTVIIFKMQTTYMPAESDIAQF